MKFLIDVAKGVALGAGAILPGISSGVLCVVFGIYEQLVNSILGFFQDIKNNIKFLFPILIGVGVGVILFGNLLRILFQSFPIQTKFCFIGLILGSIPSLYKTANGKTGFRLHYLVYTITTFLLMLSLLYIENHFASNHSASNTSFLFLIFSGFVMSIGIVVPGVSSSVLLMLLGVYNVYLIAVSTVNLWILLPIGIGVFLGGILFLKIIQFCLNKFHIQTYYCIIGFVFGSIPILYPGFSFDFTGFLSLFLFFIGWYLAGIFEKAHS